ncbi:group II intron reverse transcriptase/maturase [Kyrpidia sp.]|uniref:group II intron reverse transcriptase/maturase n=1 Tax=Kyrpidia sp. TaxID=2073077 RepID=UPI002585B78E|nr:group II intron reverse transcriptase/maturase [Kyrpidia sp.]MCL6576223.1 group II intron reverse transcriptase/maturase [Kyrpidia sp.]
MVQESTYLKSETDLRDKLDELYAEAKKAIESGEPPRFKNLLEIAKAEVTIVTAIHRIKANHGSETAGSDGQTIREVLENQYPEIIRLVREMLDDYRPALLRRVWIPKPGKDEMRPLGIPAIADRVVQEVLRMIIEPIVEAQFFKHSYGFRPMRDAHMALERVTSICFNTGYHWVIEGDIKGCFDNINHTRLIKQLWHMGVRDRRVLMIIKKMLKAGVMNEIETTEAGTPQGGIISPLLANVYLHKLDQWIIREWESKQTKHNYSRKSVRTRALRKRTNLKPAYLVRYADDWVLITNTKANAEKWKRRIQKYLGVRLKLTLNEEKTLITNVREKPIHFLGHEMKLVRHGKSRTGWKTQTRPDRKRLANKMQEIRQKLKALRRHDGKELIHQINVVNSAIVGIGNYYRTATMVNPDLNRYAKSLQWTAYNALKERGVKWISAKEVHNLPARHSRYETKIPAVKAEDVVVGVTSLGFVKWEKATLKNPIETPYTPEGREAYRQRTGKFRSNARDDPAMSLTLSEVVAKGLTDKKYNFEYVMNRAYAYNRDRGKCRVCGEYIYPADLHVHHQRPYLPLDQVNKVGELVSLHKRCHVLVHSREDLSEKLPAKVWKRIVKLREKLEP